MPAAKSCRRPEELARPGSKLFEVRARPMLRPEDDGKFVARNVQTGDYEVDEECVGLTILLRLQRRL
jgi:hypothetical protein